MPVGANGLFVFFLRNTNQGDLERAKGFEPSTPTDVPPHSVRSTS
jgi:hypothetical protein